MVREWMDMVRGVEYDLNELALGRVDTVAAKPSCGVPAYSGRPRVCMVVGRHSRQVVGVRAEELAALLRQGNSDAPATCTRSPGTRSSTHEFASRSARRRSRQERVTEELDGNCVDGAKLLCVVLVIVTRCKLLVRLWLRRCSVDGSDIGRGH